MIEENWIPTTWKIDRQYNPKKCDPFITLTEGDYIVRYGHAALNHELKWVPRPKSKADAHILGVVCNTLDEAKQRYVDYEILFNIERDIK